MFDARLRPLIDPPLNAAGRWIAGRGISANAVTLIGLAFGLLAAQGEAVLFLDADDTLADDALQRYRNTLENGDCVAVLGGVQRVDEGGAILPCADNRNTPSF